MKSKIVIDIANDFSKVPAGRYRSDGPVSGTVFREDILMPALRSANVVEIVLDGTEGYGSSFLEESFGGLIRKEGLTMQDFKQRLRFVSNDDPTYIEEIEGYVTDEEARRLAKK